MRTFHHSSFADATSLLRLKENQGLTISLGIPTLNEGATIARIVETLRRTLMLDVPLLDEIAVIDSGSQDDTLRSAAEAGAKVFLASDLLPEAGPACGKGENLWKALAVLSTDLLCFIDGDIEQMHPRFITGLVGPLLSDANTGYVKAFYRRPFQGATPDPHCGGRVTEILIRPLLATFYPALNDVIQPLAGEFAARRTVLENLPYPSGYSIEIAHLLNLDPGILAQVDLETRQHRNRPTQELGRMAFDLTQTFMNALKKRGVVADGFEPGVELHQFPGIEMTANVHRSEEIIRPSFSEWRKTRLESGLK